MSDANIVVSLFRALIPHSLAEASAAPHFKIPPDVPARIYKDFLIPLTKDIEVEYLMQRYAVLSAL